MFRSRSLLVLSIACATLLVASAAESDGQDQLKTIASWVQKKLTDIGRSYGGGGGGGGYQDEGYSMNHYHYDDDDENEGGLFSSGGLIGGLLAGVVTLGGIAFLLALLAPLLAPLLMAFTNNMGTGVVTPVIPTIIPTAAPGRKKRHSSDFHGIGAEHQLVEFSLEKLQKIQDAIHTLKIDQSCSEYFICSVHKRGLVKKLGEYRHYFEDILRFDLSGVSSTNVVHSYQKVANMGHRQEKCLKKSGGSCSFAEAAIARLMRR